MKYTNDIGQPIISYEKKPYLLCVSLNVNGNLSYMSAEDLENTIFTSSYGCNQYMKDMSNNKFYYRRALTTEGNGVLTCSKSVRELGQFEQIGRPEWIGILKEVIEENKSKINFKEMFPNGNEDFGDLVILVVHSQDYQYGENNSCYKEVIQIDGVRYNVNLINMYRFNMHKGFMLSHELCHTALCMDLYGGHIYSYVQESGIMSINSSYTKEKGIMTLDPVHRMWHGWMDSEKIDSFPITKTGTTNKCFIVQTSKRDVVYLIEYRGNRSWDTLSKNCFIIWRINKQVMSRQIVEGFSNIEGESEQCMQLLIPNGEKYQQNIMPLAELKNGVYKLPYINVSVNGTSITINRADIDGNIDSNFKLLDDPKLSKTVKAYSSNSTSIGNNFDIEVIPPDGSDDVKAYFLDNYFEKEGVLIGDNIWRFDTTGFVKKSDTVQFSSEYGLNRSGRYKVDLDISDGETEPPPTTIPVTSVSLNKTSHTFTDYTTMQLTATVLPNNATDKSITWSSSNSNVASVSSSGLVTAKTNGSCVITATTTSGSKTATCNIVVNKGFSESKYIVSGLGTLTINRTTNVSVTGVSLNKTSHTFADFTTMQLVATVAPSNATNKHITWVSNNPTVASVSANGLVTAKKNGNCTITVQTTDGAKTAVCSIVVNKEVAPPSETVSVVSGNYSAKTTDTHIDIPGSSTMLAENVDSYEALSDSNAWAGVAQYIDGKFRLDISWITWECEFANLKIIVKDKEGNITKKSNETFNLSISNDGTAPPVVNVTSVSLNKSSHTFTSLGTTQLSATILPSNATNKSITWVSSNPTIASVSTSGLVTAKKKGNCNITVQTIDGAKTAVCSITVDVNEGEGGGDGGGSGGGSDLSFDLVKYNIGTSTGYPSIGYFSKKMPTGAKLSIDGGDFTYNSTHCSASESTFDLENISDGVHRFKLKLTYDGEEAISEEGTIYKGGNGMLDATSISVSLDKSSVKMGEVAKATYQLEPYGSTSNIMLTTNDNYMVYITKDRYVEGLFTGNTVLKVTAQNTMSESVYKEINFNVVANAQTETIQITESDVKFENNKAIISKNGKTESYDLSYLSHEHFGNDYVELTNSLGHSCYLATHKDAESPFVFPNGKRPTHGGWGSPASGIRDNAFALELGTLRYGFRNVNVASNIIENALVHINSSLPQVNIHIDSNSQSTAEWQSYPDQWLGAVFTQGSTFRVCLNSRLLENRSENTITGVTVHELGHTLGFADLGTNLPTMYTYSRDREKCLYLQPNDIFYMRRVFADLINGSKESNCIEYVSDSRECVDAHFDYLHYENEEDKLNASDVCVECEYIEKDANEIKINIGSMEHIYDVFKFKVIKKIKGNKDVEDIISIKMHSLAKVDFKKNQVYKLFLAEYSEYPYSVISNKQGIEIL